MTDFHQTWSQEPLTHGIYVLWPEWGQRSRRGHRGQKGQKLKKRYSSYRLQGMITWLMYMYQLDHFYKSYHFKNSSGVIWGHRGQKVIFTKNAIAHPC